MRSDKEIWGKLKRNWYESSEVHMTHNSDLIDGLTGVDELSALKVIKRFLMWQNNLNESDLKDNEHCEEDWKTKPDGKEGDSI